MPLLLTLIERSSQIISVVAPKPAMLQKINIDDGIDGSLLF